MPFVKSCLEPVLKVKFLVLPALSADQLVRANGFGTANKNFKA
jgi:hypothetical protein